MMVLQNWGLDFLHLDFISTMKKKPRQKEKQWNTWTISGMDNCFDTPHSNERIMLFWSVYSFYTPYSPQEFANDYIFFNLLKKDTWYFFLILLWDIHETR